MADRIQYADADSVVLKRTDTTSMWDGFPVSGPPCRNVFGYENDFVTWVADEWTNTEVGTSLQNLKDAANGVLDLTSGGTEDNGNNLQLGGTGDTEATGESFLPAVGRTIWFEALVAYDDVTQSDFLIGLSKQDTTAIDTVVGIFFRKDDGDALIDAVTSSASTTASTDLGMATMSTNVYVRLGFKVTGLEKVEFYINDIKVATHSTVANIPAEAMKLTMVALTGEGNAATLSVDSIACYQTR